MDWKCIIKCMWTQPKSILSTLSECHLQDGSWNSPRITTNIHSTGIISLERGWQYQRRKSIALHPCWAPSQELSTNFQEVPKPELATWGLDWRWKLLYSNRCSITEPGSLPVFPLWKFSIGHVLFKVFCYPKQWISITSWACTTRSQKIL